MEMPMRPLGERIFMGVSLKWDTFWEQIWHFLSLLVVKSSTNTKKSCILIINQHSLMFLKTQYAKKIISFWTLTLFNNFFRICPLISTWSDTESYFCYLGVHAKIQNPSSLLAGRKATASERRKKRKKCQVLWSLRRLHSAARTNVLRLKGPQDMVTQSAPSSSFWSLRSSFSK